MRKVNRGTFDAYNCVLEQMCIRFAKMTSIATICTEYASQDSVNLKNTVLESKNLPEETVAAKTVTVQLVWAGYVSMVTASTTEVNG